MVEPLYLVTGANGFVGYEIATQLLASKKRVRAMVREVSKAIELQKLGAEVVTGDLRDSASLTSAVQGVYGVFHIAAIYRETTFPEEVFFDINAEGTKRLLDVSIGAGVKRFVHCSTGGVLGDIKNPPGDENSPYAPEDMYQRSKVEGEKIALSYFRSGKIPGVVIRPGMIYGPRDTRFLKLFKMIAHKKFFHVGPGTQWVHYIDVRDLAQAFILAMEHTERNGEIYTIAGEKPVRFKEFVNLISTCLKVPPPSMHIPLKLLQWAGSLCELVCAPFGIAPPIYRRRVDFFAKNRYFDVSKANRDLGFKPRLKLEDEVREVTEWYQQHGYIER